MKLFFSVGEPSGDHHAARLITALQRRLPNLVCEGYGGPRMVAAGLQQWYPLTNLAVMGIAEVLPLYFEFRRLVFRARDGFRENRPDAVVLVDFPGFNWHIAKAAKAQGIPVYYYCPPQLWAWASWRIKKVRRYVDHVLAVLPFEAEWYRARGISVHYVGHPFFDEVAEKPLAADFLQQQKNLPGRRVAILPGSRKHEVRNNFPNQVAIARNLTRDFPDIRFLVANYKDSQQQFCEAYLKEQAPELPITTHLGRTSEILELAECAMMVSGSVSLELLAREVPAAVQYHVDWLTYLTAKLLVTCKYMSLPNLLSDRLIMPEFVSVGRHAGQPIAEMTRTLHTWLSDSAALGAIRQELHDLRGSLMRTGASETAAEVLTNLLPASTGMQKLRAA